MAVDHIASMKRGIAEKMPNNEIIRKVYLTYPTSAFVDLEDVQYEILNAIATNFSVPIRAIHICGSAKLGASIQKGTKFEPANSDLDVAIIDSSLFQKMTELVHRQTNGFFDNSAFKNAAEYKKYVLKGIFRPDLMPASVERAEWTKFFAALSVKHMQMFKSISAAVYLSDYYFEKKQSSLIDILAGGSV